MGPTIVKVHSEKKVAEIAVARFWPIFGWPSNQKLAPQVRHRLLSTFQALPTQFRTPHRALGLDPGLGALHTDAPARDSLACDLSVG
jgi:hypothetical protein